MLLRTGCMLVLLEVLASPAIADDKTPVRLPEPDTPGLQTFLDAAKRKPKNPYAEKNFEKRLAQLIRQLGDRDPAKRKAAQKDLQAIGNPARSALERAKKSENAEIAAGAGRILAALPKLTHVVTNVFDKPIPRAKVTLRLTPTQVDMPAILRTVVLYADAGGQVAIGSFPVGGYSLTARMEHADFGVAQCRVERPAGALRFPLVKRDSDLYQRAVKGVVVDHDEKPVAGAVIQCRSVRTPGQGLINGLYPRGDAVTDSRGRFSCYLANKNRDKERGELIPTNSRYQLLISTPDNPSLFPATGMYSNLAPVRIRLSHAARFHRIFFEAAGGGVVEDPKLLRSFRIQLEGKRDGQRTLISLSPDVALKGRKLIPGTYRASGFINGKSIQFRPLIVKNDSPEKLYFQLQPAAVYRGRVIHGVTGKPIPNAFLIGWSSTARNNLALLTASDWKLLRTTPSRPDLKHPAIERLRKFYGVKELVRTDKDGKFKISRLPGKEFYGLLAFDENFVPFKKRLHYLDPSRKKAVLDAGEFPLFPAAKVLVRPVFEGPRLSVSPRWLPAKANQPEWIDRFRAAGDGSKQEFEYIHWLKLNELQPIFVPADLRLRLKLETPYDDKWAPYTCPETIQLTQGATHEIGDVRFRPTLPAVVHVVDKDGKSVEGIPVRRMHNEERAWCVAHNTNKEGRAFFFVNPHSQGKFRVSDIRGPKEVSRAKNLFADFKVEDKAPPGEFQIQITDEQIRLLLGSK